MNLTFTIHFKILLLTVSVFFISNTEIAAQGCVANRGFSGCTGNIGEGTMIPKGYLLIGTNFRSFQSFLHFRGDHEKKHRIKEGTQVINDSYFLDFSATYGISNRWYANLIVPFVYHNRSSIYEHGGNTILRKLMVYLPEMTARSFPAMINLSFSYKFGGSRDAINMHVQNLTN